MKLSNLFLKNKTKKQQQQHLCSTSSPSNLLDLAKQRPFSKTRFRCFLWAFTSACSSWANTHTSHEQRVWIHKCWVKLREKTYKYFFYFHCALIELLQLTNGWKREFLMENCTPVCTLCFCMRLMAPARDLSYPVDPEAGTCSEIQLSSRSTSW